MLGGLVQAAGFVVERELSASVPTMGRTMAKPAGMRAKYRASRDRPVTTRWRKTPSVKSADPALAPSVAATMNPKVGITPATSVV